MANCVKSGCKKSALWWQSLKTVSQTEWEKSPAGQQRREEIKETMPADFFEDYDKERYWTLCDEHVISSREDLVDFTGADESDLHEPVLLLDKDERKGKNE